MTVGYLPLNPGQFAGDLAARAVRGVAETLSVPANRAYWGAYVFTLVVLRRKHVPPAPAILTAVLAAEAASMAWNTMEDIRALARDRVPRDIDDGICKKTDCPNFGGVWRDCPQFKEAPGGAGAE